MKIKHSLLLTVFFLSCSQQGFAMQRLSNRLNNFVNEIKERDMQQQAAYRESYLRHTQIVHKAPVKKFDPIAEKRTIEVMDISFELNHKQ